MRGFFLLLLLCNAAYTTWLVWLAPPAIVPKPYDGEVMEKQGLRLLSELSETEQPAARKTVPLEEGTEEKLQASDTRQQAAVPLTTTVLPTVKGCYRSIPLSTLDEALALQQLLLRAGVQESERHTIETVKLNFWVMLPAFETRGAAEKAEAILKQNGIKDMVIVRSGRHENAISLGVYSTLERAELRRMEINTIKGARLRPVIEGLETPQKQLVITFELGEGAVAPELVPLVANDEGKKIEKIRCK